MFQSLSFTILTVILFLSPFSKAHADTKPLIDFDIHALTTTVELNGPEKHVSFKYSVCSSADLSTQGVGFDPKKCFELGKTSNTRSVVDFSVVDFYRTALQNSLTLNDAKLVVSFWYDCGSFDCYLYHQIVNILDLGVDTAKTQLEFPIAGTININPSTQVKATIIITVKASPLDSNPILLAANPPIEAYSADVASRIVKKSSDDLKIVDFMWLGIAYYDHPENQVWTELRNVGDIPFDDKDLPKLSNYVKALKEHASIDEGMNQYLKRYRRAAQQVAPTLAEIKKNAEIEAQKAETQHQMLLAQQQQAQAAKQMALANQKAAAAAQAQARVLQQQQQADAVGTIAVFGALLGSSAAHQAGSTLK